MGPRKDNDHLACSGPMPLGLASTDGLGRVALTLAPFPDCAIFGVQDRAFK
jgi:hypothetical protein